MDWYKYIGRDNEVREEGTPVSLQEMFSACLTSINAPSLEECFQAYDKAEEEESQRLKRSMAWFFGSEEPESADAVDPHDGSTPV